MLNQKETKNQDGKISPHGQLGIVCRHCLPAFHELFFAAKGKSCGAAGVHEKSEPQVSWLCGVGHLRVKRKLGVGFRGLFFFVSFFWRSKRKINAYKKLGLQKVQNIFKIL